MSSIWILERENPFRWQQQYWAPQKVFITDEATISIGYHYYLIYYKDETTIQSHYNCHCPSEFKPY